MIDRRGFIRAGAATLAAFAAPSCRSGERSLRIAHLTDPQFGFGEAIDASGDAYAADLARFEKAIEKVNSLRPDIALITGDMTHRPEDVAKDWPRLLGEFDMPVIVAPGNHDMGDKVERAKLDRYRGVFGCDYAAFDVNGWRIIAGNTQYWFDTELVLEKSAYEEWLKSELRSSSGKRIVLCGHIPPFANDPGEKDAYWNYPREGRFARMDMYLEAGAKFFLAGHTHRFAVRGWKGLTILNAENTSRSFDSRPFGFRLFDVADECRYSYDFIGV